MAARTRQKAETALRARPPVTTRDVRLLCVRSDEHSQWPLRIRVTAISMSPDKYPSHRHPTAFMRGEDRVGATSADATHDRIGGASCTSGRVRTSGAIFPEIPGHGRGRPGGSGIVVARSGDTRHHCEVGAFVWGAGLIASRFRARNP